VFSRKVELDLSQQDGKYFKPSFYIVFTVYHCCWSLYLTNCLVTVVTNPAQLYVKTQQAVLNANSRISK